MLVYDLLNHQSTDFKPVGTSFQKNKSLIAIRNFPFRHLDLATTFLLKVTNSVSPFANNQPDTIIWNCNNHSIRTGRSIRCKQVLMNDFLRVNFFWKLVCSFKLFRSDSVACCFISCQNFYYNFSCLDNFLISISDNKHVLVVSIICCQWVTVLVRTSSTDQYFATSHFF